MGENAVVKSVVICNGEKNSRRVVISQEGIVRDVLKVQRNVASYQVALEGDLVFQQQWADEKVFIIKDGVMVELPIAEAGLSWHLCPDALCEWVDCNFGAQNSILPAGFGWDGKHTNAELKKIDIITNFFSGFESNDKDKILEFAKFSPKKGMPTNWKDVPKGTVPACLEATPGHVWAVWFFDGSQKLISELKDTRNVRGAAKIKIGAYQNAHGSYGVLWDLVRCGAPEKKETLSAEAAA